jgi:hypothetical protein
MFLQPLTQLSPEDNLWPPIFWKIQKVIWN